MSTPVEGAKPSEDCRKCDIRAGCLSYIEKKIGGDGLCTMANTLFHELEFDSDEIERQLAHTEGSQTKAACNRAEHMSERCKAMQKWAGHLDKLREVAEHEGQT